MRETAKPILVVGGGIAGMTVAVEAAEVGSRVVLVEREAYLGGRVLRMHRYFPKMCPPSCGFEINLRRIKQNPRITVHTLASVVEVSGRPGDFEARINIQPRYVTGAEPIPASVVENLSSVRPDAFNDGLGTTKALYLPHDAAYPPLHVLDREALSEADAQALAAACDTDTIDLTMTEQEIVIPVGAVVIATGWRPYDAHKLVHLGFGRYENVITNVMMERLAASRGPTGGEILRPADGQPAVNVAFVQCAGSRDDDHLPYCSSVCCMASLKQVRYLTERNPAARATVFYIDVRSVGRLEKFYHDLLDDQRVSFIKGKVAEVTEDPADKNLALSVEDTVAGDKLDDTFDLVVLATGMVPNRADIRLPQDLAYDRHGFLVEPTAADGVFAAGCVKHPSDVSRVTKEATAAALRALQCVDRGD